MWNWIFLLLCVFFFFSRLHSSRAQIRVEAVFNQRGVQGNIVFSQNNPESNTSIAVNLTGLENFQDTLFPWHVHQYPYPHDGQPNPCRGDVTGGHYDPTGAVAASAGDYAANCADDPNQCELGDLSGRLGRLSSSTPSVQFQDSFIRLYGVYSVIGRSVVIHFTNGTRLICANIGYPSDSNEETANVLYVPFRNQFTGNIFFRQHTSNSMSSVYTDLTRTVGSVNSSNHNWHVHESPLDTAGTDCSIAGPHYNPLGVDASTSQYQATCNSTSQSNCEIGDLSNKGAPFNVVNGFVRQFYSDTDLPLSGENISIVDRSVVIHEADRGGPRIACANISRYSPLEAEAVFTNQDGTPITGSISFSQTSPFDRTRVDVQLAGLGGMAGGYHVHVSPIGPFGLGYPTRCSGTYAGGHWNPLDVMYGGGRDPVTSDDYEIGDLSGKFGSLSGLNTISQSFYDPNLPLSGPFGIIGRSIVIHRDDSDGTRWTCADVVHARSVVQVTYSINTSSIVGQVTFVQPADDPSAETTIVIELEVIGELVPVQLLSSSRNVPVVTTAVLSSTPFPSVSSSFITTQFPSTTISSSSAVVTSPSLVPTPTPSSVIVQESTSQMLTTSSLESISSSASSSLLEVQASSLPPSPSFLPSPTPMTSSLLLVPPSSTMDEPRVTTSELSPSSTTAISSTADELSPSLTSPSSSTPGELSSSLPTTTVLSEPTLSTMDELLPTSATGLSSTIAELSPSSTSTSTTNELSSSSTSLDERLSTSPLLTSNEGSQFSSPMVVPTTAEFVSSEILAMSTASPSPTMMGNRRRKRSLIKRKKRQTPMAIAFDWSFREGGASTDPSLCGSLPVLSTSPSNSNMCSMGFTLSCDIGDLVSKHGPLNLPQAGGLFRKVITDPYLPLSGPSSAFSDTSSSQPLLLVQPVQSVQGDGAVVCNGNAEIELLSAAPPTTPPSSSPTLPGTEAPSQSLIGPVVGGVLAAVVVVLVIVLVILLFVCLVKRKRSSKYDMSKATDLEMRDSRPKKPILGVPNYKILHRYDAQKNDDLTLVPGEWVTLKEAPYGGGWWKGSIEDRGSGWFPKTYVEYVDRDAERKKKKDESFTQAAASIMDASSSFSTRRSSVAGHEAHISPEHASASAGRKGSKSAKRRHTFNKNQIDSTPKMVTKFDRPYLEREDIPGLTVIENQTRDGGSQSGGSRPDTPRSIRNNEIIENAQAMDSGGSQEDDFALTKALLAKGDLGENLLPQAERYVVKFDFEGTTDLELEFKSGDVIKVIEKSDNGWWKGVHEGLIGWFPESYIDPTPLPSTHSIALDEAETGGLGGGTEVERPRNMDETMTTGDGGDLEASEYHALYSFQSGAEGDLAFNEGDTVLVYWAQDNGWWFGAFGGKQGWFPESYVQPIIDVSMVESAEGAAEGGTAVQHQVSDSGGADANSTSPLNSQEPLEKHEESEREESEIASPLKQDLQGGPVIERDSMDHYRPPSVDSGISSDPIVDTSSTSKTTPDEIAKTETGKTAEKQEEEKQKDEKQEEKTPPVQKPTAVAKPNQKTRRQTAPLIRRAPPPPPGSTLRPPSIAEEEHPSPQQQQRKVPAQSTPKDKPQIKDSVKKPPASPLLIDNRAAIDKDPGPSPLSLPTQTVAQPDSGKKQDKRKRRTTALNNGAKPHRRPPPPVPPALLDAAAAGKSSAGKSSQEVTKPLENAEPNKVVLSGDKPETPTGTPIPPPRAKARRKKVKRPTSRMIPPPPNIPLPPPPKKNSSPTAVKHKQNASLKSTNTSNIPGKPPGVEALIDTETNAVTGSPKGPRPPPPRRISSLGQPIRPAPPKNVKKTKGLLEVKEEEVSGRNNDKGSKFAPPKRPPPPRPTSMISTESSEKPKAAPRSVEKTPSELKAEKPSSQDVLGDDDAARAIAPRGSKLMSSLKKMVKRDSKKTSKPGPPKPQRPFNLPGEASTKKAPEPSTSGESSPVPKPRTKKKSSVSEPPKGAVTSSQEKDKIAPHSVTQTSSNPPPESSSSPATATTDPASLQQVPPRPSHPPSTTLRKEVKANSDATSTPPTYPARSGKNTSISSPKDLKEVQTQEGADSQTPPARRSSNIPSPAAATVKSAVNEVSDSQTPPARGSSNIPSKPPPPATVKPATKPKPPLAPKPSLGGGKPSSEQTITTPTATDSKIEHTNGGINLSLTPKSVTNESQLSEDTPT